jgi:hypothetical protein
MDLRDILRLVESKLNDRLYSHPEDLKKYDRNYPDPARTKAINGLSEWDEADNFINGLKPSPVGRSDTDPKYFKPDPGLQNQPLNSPKQLGEFDLPETVREILLKRMEDMENQKKKTRGMI